MRKFYFIIIFLFGAFQAQADCGTQSVAAPVIDSVSVLPNGDIEICWQMPFPLDPNLAGFNVWTVDGTGANLLLTPGSLSPATSCYTYSAANNNASAQSVQILIEAFDNCPIPGPFSSGIFPGGFVNTIYLQEDFKECTSSIELNWNAYDDFSNPSVRYDVYASVNSAPASLVGSTFATTYSYLNVVPGNTYSFYVTAVENGGVGPFKSTSNVVNSDVSTALISSKFNYLYNATVVDDNQIDLQFLVDTAADITAYKVMRSTEENGAFLSVGAIPKITGMDTIIAFADTTELKTDSISYFYKIDAVNDNCGFTGNYSNLAKTILIDVESSPIEAINTVTISEYKEWDLGALRYDIYRALGGVWDAAPIKSLLAFSDTATFYDDVSDVFDGDGEFCYRVEAIAKGSNPAISSSNEACAFHNPLIYVPNAFAPRGEYNKEFKPVLTFANPGAYTFRVFDRWGQVAFETSDVTTGWNGSYKNSGNLAPPGVYFYVVDFESAEGEEFIKRGTVTIVN